MQAVNLKEKSARRLSSSHLQRNMALQDITGGLAMWRVWLLLSWQDIKLRYRRSTLGPFWITISMAVTIYAMGFLYGVLFKQDLSVYYPFLATGILSWGLISTIICEGPSVFIDSERFIKQMKQPYLMFIFRMVIRNFIIFFHNIVVFIPIIIIFHVKINWNILYFLLGLLLVWINGVSYSTILAILGARYRDLSQLISSLVQIIFFLTPILWSSKLLPKNLQFIVQYNPFAEFIELLRNSLLGMPVDALTLSVVFTVTLLGICLAFPLFIKYRPRIVYWL